MKFNSRQIIYFQKIQIDLKYDYFRTLTFCYKLISWFRFWEGRGPWISISLLNWIKALVKELETLFSIFWGFFFFLSSSENLVSLRPTLIFLLFLSSKVPMTSRTSKKKVILALSSQLWEYYSSPFIYANLSGAGPKLHCSIDFALLRWIFSVSAHPSFHSSQFCFQR